MPTVKFGASLVTKGVKANLRRNIESLPDLGKKHRRVVYNVALRSIKAGRDLHMLATALVSIAGMSNGRAGEVALSLHNKATAEIERDRSVSLGITHATWLYGNAPCMKNPFKPTDAETRQDAAHKEANGKRYEVRKGLFLDGKWTWPGMEEGCKCVSRIVLPE